MKEERQYRVSWKMKERTWIEPRISYEIYDSKQAAVDAHRELSARRTPAGRIDIVWDLLIEERISTRLNWRQLDEQEV